MYYLKLIFLNNCPYSEAAKELILNNKIKSKIIKVEQNEKEKFKTDKINTFPQIYLEKKNSKGSQLIGGYDIFKEIYDAVKSNSSLNSIKDKITNKINISNKSLLRLIELLN